MTRLSLFSFVPCFLCSALLCALPVIAQTTDDYSIYEVCIPIVKLPVWMVYYLASQYPEYSHLTKTLADIIGSKGIAPPHTQTRPTTDVVTTPSTAGQPAATPVDVTATTTAPQTTTVTATTTTPTPTATAAMTPRPTTTTTTTSTKTPPKTFTTTPKTPAVVAPVSSTTQPTTATAAATTTSTTTTLRPTTTTVTTTSSKTPPMIPTTTTVAPISDEAFLIRLLEVHNCYRENVSIKPLKWSAELAQFAANYVRRQDMYYNCKFEHSSDQSRARIGQFTNAGENLYMSVGFMGTPDRVMRSWYKEIDCYNYGNVGERCVRYSGPKCEYNPIMTGHFTQLMWSSSTHVGCSRLQCRSCNTGQCPMVYIACNYGSATGAYGGNLAGTPPFSRTVAEKLNIIRGPCPTKEVAMSINDLALQSLNHSITTVAPVSLPPSAVDGNSTANEYFTSYIWNTATGGLLSNTSNNANNSREVYYHVNFVHYSDRSPGPLEIKEEEGQGGSTDRQFSADYCAKA